MSTHRGPARVCRDRCEVCNAVIQQRPIPDVRRCAEHLDQLVLVPEAPLRRRKNSKRREGR